VRLGVNQGDTNHNRYTQRLVISHTKTYYNELWLKKQKRRSVWPTTLVEIDPKVGVNRHFQGSWTSQHMGCLLVCCYNVCMPWMVKAEHFSRPYVYVSFYGISALSSATKHYWLKLRESCYLEWIRDARVMKVSSRDLERHNDPLVSLSLIINDLYVTWVIPQIRQKFTEF